MCNNSNCKCGGVCTASCTCEDNRNKARMQEYYDYREHSIDMGVNPVEFDTWLFQNYGE